jgi:hypothetical protein
VLQAFIHVDKKQVAMTNRQSSTNALSPEQEDRKLFKTYGGPIAVDMIPHVFRGSAGDVLIRGFFNKDVEIDVVFPGRRAAETGPLLAQLKAVDSQMRMKAAGAGRPAPPVTSIRMPVQIKGSWRHEFRQDAEGKDIRSYQLVAARWAYADKSGQLAQFGDAPAVLPQARTRKKSYILNAREFDAVQQSFQQE